MKDKIDLVLLQDLGKNYDPKKSLEFLRALKEKYNDVPEVTHLKKILSKPPQNDTTLHVIYKTPFILGEIVLAGKETREKFPLTNSFPVHFKKTILPSYGSLTLKGSEANPFKEREVSKMVWEHFKETFEEENDWEVSPNTPLPVPLPLGATSNTYRSELLEGKTLGATSPIHNSNNDKELAEQVLTAKKAYGSFKKLWEGLEEVDKEIRNLHNGGLLHKDLHRENILLIENQNNTDEGQETRLRGAIIDFETAEEDERYKTETWEEACREDKALFLEEASLILLCTKKEEINKTTQFYKEVLDFSQKSQKINNTKKIIKNIEEKEQIKKAPVI